MSLKVTLSVDEGMKLEKAYPDIASQLASMSCPAVVTDRHIFCGLDFGPKELTFTTVEDAALFSLWWFSPRGS
jgi:hypothetical protein